MFIGTQVQLNSDKLTTESEVANIVVQYLLDLQEQQNQAKKQESIVFSSLTERAGTSSKGSPPSTVASPPSVCSIPQSPMSILSDASSIQPVTDSQSFGHCPNQASTSTNEQELSINPKGVGCLKLRLNIKEDRRQEMKSDDRTLCNNWFSYHRGIVGV